MTRSARSPVQNTAIAAQPLAIVDRAAAEPRTRLQFRAPHDSEPSAQSKLEATARKCSLSVSITTTICN